MLIQVKWIQCFTLIIIIRDLNITVGSVVQDNWSLRWARRAIVSHHLRVRCTHYSLVIGVDTIWIILCIGWKKIQISGWYNLSIFSNKKHIRQEQEWKPHFLSLQLKHNVDRELKKLLPLKEHFGPEMNNPLLRRLCSKAQHPSLRFLDHLLCENSLFLRWRPREPFHQYSTVAVDEAENGWDRH